MAGPDIKTIRNMAVIGQGGGGKTMLVESLLFAAKAIQKRGSTDKGDAVMITEPEEVSRKVTITPHIGFCQWEGNHFNVCDTPGYINFLEQTRTVLWGMDSAVLVVGADMGLRPEGERAFGMTQDLAVPTVACVSKCDVGGDFAKLMKEMAESLELPVLPITFPMGTGEKFKGVVDVIKMKAYSAKDDAEMDIPADYKADAESYREKITEAAAEGDDALMEKYLETLELNADEIRQGLRSVIIQRKCVPAFAVVGTTGAGIKAFADGVVAYLPSPADIEAHHPFKVVDSIDRKKEITRKRAETEPLCAVIFKTAIDHFSGKLSIVQVMSGTLLGDVGIYNGTRQEKDKCGHIYRLQGKEMIQVEKLYAGEVGCIAKLNSARTGDTLCDDKTAVHVPGVKYIEPILTFAVEAEGKTEEKVTQGLHKLAEEDPSLRFYREDESNEMLLCGMGQNHLEVTLERLKRKFGAAAKLKTQQVPYRETIRKAVRVEGKLKKQTGGRGQFGHCWLEVEPRKRGEGYIFEDKIVGGVIPRNFIPSVEKGVVESMKKGILGGYPVVDMRVAVVDGSYHDVDSSDNAFRIAGSMAFKKAMETAEAVILEPVMSMEIFVPEETMGNVIKDLSSRRGKVMGTDSKGSTSKIKSEVPMGEVLEYGNILQSITAGRGIFTMQMASYQAAPPEVVKKIVAAYEAVKKAKGEGDE
jgi:elongation factor G